LQAEAQMWGYAKDEFTDNRNFPHQMYVREARRMIGEYVMTEHNCLGKEVVKDGVGKGAYGMDSHFCQRVVVDGMVKNEGNLNVEGFPAYPIAYRSLTPKREACENLLVPVALSASHIAYGSIRMEPVFMVLGQSSAVAAAMAIDQQTSVQQVDVPALQALLKENPLLDGTPTDILADDSDAAAVQYQGDWEHVERLEIPQPYKGSYLISREKAAKGQWVRFNLHIQESGKHEFFFFHPIVLGWKQAYSSRTTFSVRANGQETEKTVDFSQLPINQNWGEWVSLGTYEFSEDGEEYVELIGGKSTPPLVADAVLAVWRE